jgi:hypothetical protein
MPIRTPIKNLYVTGTFNLVGNATVNGNVNITGNLILGNTIINEESYNDLVFLINQPLLPGPKGDEGPQGQEGQQGPPGELFINENNDITNSERDIGVKGDLAFGLDNGNYYLYICYRSGNWGRIPLDINFASFN